MKKQKGSITLFVLVSCLFFTVFLTSMFMLGAVKRQTQEEILGQTQEIYEQKIQEEIYAQYFANGAIPIYTKDQLLKIGTGEKVTIKEQGGKIYTFDLNSQYILMNPIELEYNGVWQLPEVNFEGQNYEIKIKDTSKVEETYYYYTKQNKHKQALTKEGYIYDTIQVDYDGINNTGNGHNRLANEWKDVSGNGRNGSITGIDHTTRKLLAKQCFTFRWSR